MKKLFPVLMLLMLFLGACGGAAGQNAEPTSIPIAAALPTATPVPLNPTAEPVEAGSTEAGAERVSPVDGMVQIFIPDGSFRMGGMDVNAETDEKPDHMVTMSAFWLDKLEVTNAMYMLCVQQGACEPPDFFRSEKHEKYFNTEEYADYPVIYVSWGDADNYCTWAGKRLPTEAEWEYAARGTDFRAFPWGDERPDTSRANFDHKLNDVARVGSFPAGASAFGVLDMAGNVWEWVGDFYDSNYYSLAIAANPSGPMAAMGYNEQRRSIRGGSYQDVEKDIRLSNRGYASGPNPEADMDTPEYNGESSPKIGFRCASDN